MVFFLFQQSGIFIYLFSLILLFINSSKWWTVNRKQFDDKNFAINAYASFQNIKLLGDSCYSSLALLFHCFAAFNANIIWSKFGRVLIWLCDNVGDAWNLRRLIYSTVTPILLEPAFFLDSPFETSSFFFGSWCQFSYHAHAHSTSYTVLMMRGKKC